MGNKRRTTADEDSQTRLQVYPFFVNLNERAQIQTDEACQTVITVAPRLPNNEIVTELSYIPDGEIMTDFIAMIPCPPKKSRLHWNIPPPPRDNYDDTSIETPSEEELYEMPYMTEYRFGGFSYGEDYESIMMNEYEAMLLQSHGITLDEANQPVTLLESSDNNESEYALEEEEDAHLKSVLKDNLPHFIEIETQTSISVLPHLLCRHDTAVVRHDRNVCTTITCEAHTSESEIFPQLQTALAHDKTVRFSKSSIKVDDIQPRKNVPTEEQETQTALKVFPHLLGFNEFAIVTTELETQTSITCCPRCSLSDIIPKLKSCISHEGFRAGARATGDSKENVSMLDMIRELIEEVEYKHENLFEKMPSRKNTEVENILHEITAKLRPELEELIMSNNNAQQFTDDASKCLDRILLPYLVDPKTVDAIVKHVRSIIKDVIQEFNDKHFKSALGEMEMISILTSTLEAATKRLPCTDDNLASNILSDILRKMCICKIKSKLDQKTYDDDEDSDYLPLDTSNEDLRYQVRDMLKEIIRRNLNCMSGTKRLRTSTMKNMIGKILQDCMTALHEIDSVVSTQIIDNISENRLKIAKSIVNKLSPENAAEISEDILNDIVEKIMNADEDKCICDTCLNPPKVDDSCKCDPCPKITPVLMLKHPDQFEDKSICGCESQESTKKSDLVTIVDDICVCLATENLPAAEKKFEKLLAVLSECDCRDKKKDQESDDVDMPDLVNYEGTVCTSCKKRKSPAQDKHEEENEVVKAVHKLNAESCTCCQGKQAVKMCVKKHPDDEPCYCVDENFKHLTQEKPLKFPKFVEEIPPCECPPEEEEVEEEPCECPDEIVQPRSPPRVARKPKFVEEKEEPCTCEEEPVVKKQEGSCSCPDQGSCHCIDPDEIHIPPGARNSCIAQILDEYCKCPEDTISIPSTFVRRTNFVEEIEPCECDDDDNEEEIETEEEPCECRDDQLPEPIRVHPKTKFVEEIDPCECSDEVEIELKPEEPCECPDDIPSIKAPVPKKPRFVKEIDPCECSDEVEIELKPEEPCECPDDIPSIKAPVTKKPRFVEEIEPCECEPEPEPEPIIEDPCSCPESTHEVKKPKEKPKITPKASVKSKTKCTCTPPCPDDCDCQNVQTKKPPSIALSKTSTKPTPETKKRKCTCIPPCPDDCDCQNVQTKPPTKCTCKPPCPVDCDCQNLQKQQSPIKPPTQLRKSGSCQCLTECPEDCVCGLGKKAPKAIETPERCKCSYECTIVCDCQNKNKAEEAIPKIGPCKRCLNDCPGVCDCPPLEVVPAKKVCKCLNACSEVCICTSDDGEEGGRCNIDTSGIKSKSGGGKSRQTPATSGLPQIKRVTVSVGTVRRGRNYAEMSDTPEEVQPVPQESSDTKPETLFIVEQDGNVAEMSDVPGESNELVAKETKPGIPEVSGTKVDLYIIESKITKSCDAQSEMHMENIKNERKEVSQISLICERSSNEIDLSFTESDIMNPDTKTENDSVKKETSPVQTICDCSSNKLPPSHTEPDIIKPDIETEIQIPCDCDNLKPCDTKTEVARISGTEPHILKPDEICECETQPEMNIGSIKQAENDDDKKETSPIPSICECSSSKIPNEKLPPCVTEPDIIKPDIGTEIESPCVCDILKPCDTKTEVARISGTEPHILKPDEICECDTQLETNIGSIKQAENDDEKKVARISGTEPHILEPDEICECDDTQPEMNTGSIKQAEKDDEKKETLSLTSICECPSNQLPNLLPLSVEPNIPNKTENARPCDTAPKVPKPCDLKTETGNILKTDDAKTIPTTVEDKTCTCISDVPTICHCKEQHADSALSSYSAGNIPPIPVLTSHEYYHYTPERVDQNVHDCQICWSTVCQTATCEVAGKDLRLSTAANMRSYRSKCVQTVEESDVQTSESSQQQCAANAAAEAKEESKIAASCSSKDKQIYFVFPRNFPSKEVLQQINEKESSEEELSMKGATSYLKESDITGIKSTFLLLSGKKDVSNDMQSGKRSKKVRFLMDDEDYSIDVRTTNSLPLIFSKDSIKENKSSVTFAENRIVRLHDTEKYSVSTNTPNKSSMFGFDSKGVQMFTIIETKTTGTTPENEENGNNKQAPKDNNDVVESSSSQQPINKCKSSICNSNATPTSTCSAMRSRSCGCATKRKIETADLSQLCAANRSKQRIHQQLNSAFASTQTTKSTLAVTKIMTNICCSRARFFGVDTAVQCNIDNVEEEEEEIKNEDEDKNDGDDHKKDKGKEKRNHHNKTEEDGNSFKEGNKIDERTGEGGRTNKDRGKNKTRAEDGENKDDEFLDDLDDQEDVRKVSSNPDSVCETENKHSTESELDYRSAYDEDEEESKYLSVGDEESEHDVEIDNTVFDSDNETPTGDEISEEKRLIVISPFVIKNKDEDIVFPVISDEDVLHRERNANLVSGNETNSSDNSSKETSSLTISDTETIMSMCSRDISTMTVSDEESSSSDSSKETSTLSVIETGTENDQTVDLEMGENPQETEIFCVKCLNFGVDLQLPPMPCLIPEFCKTCLPEVKEETEDEDDAINKQTCEATTSCIKFPLRNELDLSLPAMPCLLPNVCGKNVCSKEEVPMAKDEELKESMRCSCDVCGVNSNQEHMMPVAGDELPPMPCLLPRFCENCKELFLSKSELQIANKIRCCDLAQNKPCVGVCLGSRNVGDLAWPCKKRSPLSQIDSADEKDSSFDNQDEESSNESKCSSDAKDAESSIEPRSSSSNGSSDEKDREFPTERSTEDPPEEQAGDDLNNTTSKVVSETQSGQNSVESNKEVSEGSTESDSKKTSEEQDRENSLKSECFSVKRVLEEQIKTTSTEIDDVSPDEKLEHAECSAKPRCLGLEEQCGQNTVVNNIPSTSAAPTNISNEERSTEESNSAVNMQTKDVGVLCRGFVLSKELQTSYEQFCDGNTSTTCRANICKYIRHLQSVHNANCPVRERCYLLNKSDRKCTTINETELESSTQQDNDLIQLKKLEESEIKTIEYKEKDSDYCNFDADPEQDIAEDKKEGDKDDDDILCLCNDNERILSCDIDVRICSEEKNIAEEEVSTSDDFTQANISDSLSTSSDDLDDFAEQVKYRIVPRDSLALKGLGKLQTKGQDSVVTNQLQFQESDSDELREEVMPVAVLESVYENVPLEFNRSYNLDEDLEDEPVKPFTFLYQEPSLYCEVYMDELLEEYNKDVELLPADDDVNEVHLVDTDYAEPYIRSMYSKDNVITQTDICMGEFLQVSLNSASDDDMYETASEGPQSARKPSPKYNLPWDVMSLPKQETITIREGNICTPPTPPYNTTRAQISPSIQETVELSTSDIEEKVQKKREEIGSLSLTSSDKKLVDNGEGEGRLGLSDSKDNVLPDTLTYEEDTSYVEDYFRPLVHKFTFKNILKPNTAFPWKIIELPTNIRIRPELNGDDSSTKKNSYSIKERSCFCASPRPGTSETCLCPSTTKLDLMTYSKSSAMRMIHRSPNTFKLTLEHNFEERKSLMTLSKLSTKTSRIIEIKHPEVSHYASTMIPAGPRPIIVRQVVEEKPSTLMSVYTFSDAEESMGGSKVKQTRSVKFMDKPQTKTIPCHECRSEKLDTVKLQPERIITSPPVLRRKESILRNKNYQTPEIKKPVVIRERERAVSPRDRDSAARNRRDHITSIISTFENELKPIRDGFSILKERLKALDMPELNCLFDNKLEQSPDFSSYPSTSTVSPKSSMRNIHVKARVKPPFTSTKTNIRVRAPCKSCTYYLPPDNRSFETSRTDLSARDTSAEEKTHSAYVRIDRTNLQVHPRRVSFHDRPQVVNISDHDSDASRVSSLCASPCSSSNYEETDDDDVQEKIFSMTYPLKQCRSSVSRIEESDSDIDTGICESRTSAAASSSEEDVHGRKKRRICVPAVTSMTTSCPFMQALGSYMNVKAAKTASSSSQSAEQFYKKYDKMRINVRVKNKKKSTRKKSNE